MMVRDITGPCATLDWALERYFCHTMVPAPAKRTSAAVAIANHFQVNPFGAATAGLPTPVRATTCAFERGLPCQTSSSSIRACAELKRSLGFRSRHLLTISLSVGGIEESTSTSGTARSCVRLTKLAIALSARNGTYPAN